jgi:hypothetical protein
VAHPSQPAESRNSRVARALEARMLYLNKPAIGHDAKVVSDLLFGVPRNLERPFAYVQRNWGAGACVKRLEA